MPNSELIKKQMKEKGVTQKDLAEAIGIAAPTVSQKLNGIRPLDLSEARIIAEKLEINAGEFGEFFFSSGVA